MEFHVMSMILNDFMDDSFSVDNQANKPVFTIYPKYFEVETFLFYIFIKLELFETPNFRKPGRLNILSSYFIFTKFSFL